MKRSAPLARTVPLKASTQLSRTTPLPRGGPIKPASLIGRQASRRTVRVTGPGQGVRALVGARDQGRCVRCSQPATELQHRRPRSLGGSSDPAINCPSNLVSVDRACHAWMESHRTEAEALGYLVRHGITDPASVPVWVHGWGWALLGTDGTRRTA